MAELQNQRKAKMTVNEVLPKLEKVRKCTSGWNALCPSHNDKTRSLSITEKDGKTLMKCFAGCDVQTIVSDLGLTMNDLFSEKLNGFQPKSVSKKRVKEIYDYTDEHGKLLYQSVRYEPKGFSQRRPNGNGDYIWNLQDTRLVLYRLPEILNAEMVFVVEGEKDVEAIRQNKGYFATCNPAGALKWRDEYNEFLRDKTAVILPDNDEPGRKHALQVAHSLYGIAKEILIIPIPNLKPKGDVSDFFQDGGTIDDIIGMIERAESWHPSENEVIEETEETKFRTLPQPNEKCFHGLAGDFVHLIEPHTEACKMALLSQFLVYFGNIIGRSAYYQVEGDKHYSNLFCVLVGKTAQGRKGTSFGRVKQFFHGLDDFHEKECLSSGLASGEGLIYHVRDSQKTEKKNKQTGEMEEIILDAGVSDKRLLVVETEFTQVLRVQGREGNTLSSFIRNLWDTGTARSLTKNSPLKTTDAHVSIIGHITQTELLLTLSEVESANGYANRFLFVAVERGKLLPFGSEVPAVELGRLQDKLADAINFSQQKGLMNFSINASKLWAKVYERLETSRFGYLGKVTQRASPYVLRLSCIYALLDKSNLIEIEHLEAALSIWQYAENSARFIFGEKLDNLNADKILSALQASNENGLSRTDIRDLFDRNLSKNEMDMALQYLFDAKLARFEKKETKGKPKEIWFARTNDFNDIND